MSLLTTLLDILSALLIVIGSVACLIGAVGLLRLPDFYTRTHATTIADTTGTILLFCGLAIQAGFTLVTAKLLLIILLVLYTSPTAAHALAQAALADNQRPWLKPDAGNSSKTAAKGDH